ncbi:hypothetical protein N7474_011211 [Penicillium riverlandense]|uniref:uncharacterized protein n=1 Tax=Penicillium riverlandense TaxID=1903569 RepID=UPI0025477CCF|nr:uncharacterized protein N7474_011211 [Penicillium riverlandense]KAJ5805324.1 hypothetical protein N7474_011211 [Penicillium riverlandense]
MAPTILTPINWTLPSSDSGGSVKKPIKTVSKPCFGCDCGGEDVSRVLAIHATDERYIVPAACDLYKNANKRRSNVTQRCRSAIGAVIIISLVLLTE